MVKASSFARYAQESGIQVTFYYVEGHTETFSIPMSTQEFQQQIIELLNQPWLAFHLVDQTVFICTARLVKLEVKPAIPGLQGPGIFPNSQLVTALQRGAAGRFQVSE